MHILVNTSKIRGTSWKENLKKEAKSPQVTVLYTKEEYVPKN
jgi:hypothetical protein